MLQCSAKKATNVFQDELMFIKHRKQKMVISAWIHGDSSSLKLCRIFQ